MDNNQLNNPDLQHKRQVEDTDKKADPIQLNTQFELEKHNIGADDFKAETEQLIKKGEEAKERKGLFIVKTASRWIEQAKTRPIPKMLFGEFWFESELCILFADTNLGKSILAVQIGDSISKGRKIPYFKFEAKKQVVVYFDFELSDKQFEGRYSNNYKNHYSFNDSFFRCEISADNETNYNKKFEDLLKESIVRTIKKKNPSVLIIEAGSWEVTLILRSSSGIISTLLSCGVLRVDKSLKMAVRSPPRTADLTSVMS